MTVRVCSQPGCPEYVSRGYCPMHARTSSRNHYGVSPSQRGHGKEYRAARAQVIGGPCALRLPGCTGVATTGDYVVPFSRGGTTIQGACLHCNASKGARVIA